jgi:hypothetical protein
MLREYEIHFDQFPSVVITMEYDESKRRTPSIQTSYGKPGDGIPQLVMNCPGKIKRVTVNGTASDNVLHGFLLLAGIEKLVHFRPEPPPPKPTPEPYEQERF